MPTAIVKSSRPKRLEEHGIVERRLYEQHPPRAEYVLTGKGDELRPMPRALLEWGERHTCWTQRSG
jgi:DNA-binding HxlR family transcriptional regulator